MRNSRVRSDAEPLPPIEPDLELLLPALEVTEVPESEWDSVVGELKELDRTRVITWR